MPYQQLQYLGGGYFGEVWLELDTGLGRRCAVKYLNPARLTPGGAAFAEAKAMIDAEHDHVVTVYSAELVRGKPVIRMEFLPASGLGWEGAAADGTTWRAGVVGHHATRGRACSSARLKVLASA